MLPLFTLRYAMRLRAITDAYVIISLMLMPPRYFRHKAHAIDDDAAAELRHAACRAAAIALIVALRHAADYCRR